MKSEVTTQFEKIALDIYQQFARFCADTKAAHDPDPKGTSWPAFLNSEYMEKYRLRPKYDRDSWIWDCVEVTGPGYRYRTTADQVPGFYKKLCQIDGAHPVKFNAPEVLAVLDPADAVPVTFAGPDLYKYTCKDKAFPQLAGVQFTGGLAIVTDTQYLFITRAQYPAKYEGQTIDKHGAKSDYNFPNWAPIFTDNQAGGVFIAKGNANADAINAATIRARLDIDEHPAINISGSNYLVEKDSPLIKLLSMAKNKELYIYPDGTKATPFVIYQQKKGRREQYAVGLIMPAKADTETVPAETTADETPRSGSEILQAYKDGQPAPQPAPAAPAPAATDPQPAPAAPAPAATDPQPTPAAAPAPQPDNKKLGYNARLTPDEIDDETPRPYATSHSFEAAKDIFNNNFMRYLGEKIEVLERGDFYAVLRYAGEISVQYIYEGGDEAGAIIFAKRKLKKYMAMQEPQPAPSPQPAPTENAPQPPAQPAPAPSPTAPPDTAPAPDTAPKIDIFLILRFILWHLWHHPAHSRTHAAARLDHTPPPSMAAPAAHDAAAPLHCTPPPLLCPHSWHTAAARLDHTPPPLLRPHSRTHAAALVHCYPPGTSLPQPPKYPPAGTSPTALHGWQHAGTLTAPRPARQQRPRSRTNSPPQYRRTSRAHTARRHPPNVPTAPAQPPHQPGAPAPTAPHSRTHGTSCTDATAHQPPGQIHSHSPHHSRTHGTSCTPATASRPPP